MTTPAADQSPTEKRKMTVSERSIPALTAGLQQWLAAGAVLPGATVTDVRAPDSNGLSSTSVLFDVSWSDADGASQGSYVARMAPEADAVPVFPRYDLGTQFELISRVAARCGIPLPRLRWNVPDGGPLGTPFFVMDRVDGRVPLDNPPYVFGGWLLEATPEERDRLMRASVQILAELHAVPAEELAVPALRQCRAGVRHRRGLGGNAAGDARGAASSGRARLAALPHRASARLLPLGAGR
jgi:aminoglycoside phosphotransferase (APT) family kinase protein